jgi:hypothetical protein
MVDDKAAEAVYQRFKHVKPRLNRAAIKLICEAYEAAKVTVGIKTGTKQVPTIPVDASEP